MRQIRETLRVRLLRRALWSAGSIASWRQTLLIGGVFTTVALPIGFASGLLRFMPEPMTVPERLRLGLALLLVPALAEELLFRGLLLPHPEEALTLPQLLPTTAVSVTAYVAWHPLNGLFFSPHARHVLFHPGFLVLTSLLGLSCSWLYLCSGSIWPPVALHWLTVMAWAGYFGGQRLLTSSNAPLILH